MYYHEKYATLKSRTSASCKTLAAIYNDTTNMSNDDIPELKIGLQLDGVVRPTLTALKECSQSVMFGLKSSNQITSLTDTFSQDEQFFKQQFGEPDTFDIQKLKYQEWLLTKGLDEIIQGINLTLVEAYRYVTIWKEWLGGKTERKLTTFEKIQRDFNELRKKSARLPQPNLLDKIKPHLTDTLLYENHIQSLNKARICLVHRKGTVTLEDTNTTTDSLKIKWMRYYLYFDYTDGEVEVSPNCITKGPVSIKLRFKEEEKEFKLNETISFSLKELQEFMTTCYLFSIDLVSKLPIIK